jgi:hypothetical protein
MTHVVIFSPNLELAMLILGLTIVVAIWKLLGFISKEAISSEPSNPLKSNIEPILKPCISKTVVFFQYSLFFIYPVFTVLTLFAEIFPNTQKQIYNFDDYLSTLIPVFILQILTVCSACLLWSYTSNLKVDRVLFWGLVMLCMGSIARVILESFHSPSLHWVQITEIMLLVVLLLPIPLLGIMLVKKMNKLSVRINK